MTLSSLREWPTSTKIFNVKLSLESSTELVVLQAILLDLLLQVHWMDFTHSLEDKCFALHFLSVVFEITGRAGKSFLVCELFCSCSCSVAYFVVGPGDLIFTFWRSRGINSFSCSHVLGLTSSMWEVQSCPEWGCCSNLIAMLWNSLGQRMKHVYFGNLFHKFKLVLLSLNGIRLKILWKINLEVQMYKSYLTLGTVAVKL